MIFTSRLVWVAACCVCAVSSKGLCEQDPPKPLHAQAYGTQQEVAIDQLHQASSQDWVVVHLGEGEEVSIWGSNLLAQEQTNALVGVSSEFLFVAVLDGKLSLASIKRSVGPGQTIIRRHLGNDQIKVHAYSAERLQRTFVRDGRQDLAKFLAPAVKHQADLRFWGLLRETNVNIGSPTRDSVERMRRQYLTPPAMLQTKQQAASVQQLPAAVARSFIVAIEQEDATSAAALLDPAPFEASVKTGQLRQSREGFIRSQLGKPWTRQIDVDSIEPVPGKPMNFTFDANQSRYLLELRVFDASLFVSSVKPFVEQAPKPQPEESNDG